VPPDTLASLLMTEIPNRLAQTEDFEFEALAQARNYRQALFAEFGSYLSGEVLEVGAGVGQMTEHLLSLPNVKRTLSIEPDARFCERHRERFPNHELIQGTSLDLPPGAAFDAILSINVLEHIEQDENELKRYAGLLTRRQGHLCLFVPARPEIYAPIDRDFGHFRRYTRPQLRARLQQAGFHILRMYYFNSAGYFAWWFNFCVLKKRLFEKEKVKLYDRLIFPCVHFLECSLLRPPFGQSLLAVARAKVP
jgi:SAM-dependent methyltransferase